MILYRCGENCPVGEIPPSNWATNSIALEFFIARRCENLQPVGEKIFVIEIPTPQPEDVGPYRRVLGRVPVEDSPYPFGSDGKGWWSFNRPYSGQFGVADVLRLTNLCLTDIDLLDTRYKPCEEWPEGLVGLLEKQAQK